MSLIPYNDENDPQYPNIWKCVPCDRSFQVALCLCVVLLNLLVAGKVKRGFTHELNRSHSNSNSIRRRHGSAMILLVVPVVCMLLNTPFHLLRIADTIALYVFKSNKLSIVAGLNGTLTIFLYNTAHYLYYINFARDAVVYAFSSSNFRRMAVIVWRQIILSHSGKIQRVANERYRNDGCRLSKLTGENIFIMQLQ
ncbi:unnamed protein product [Litomosoides sigmodontis]|uniref:Uncharacterized protein n=1 Tax=Litomosoides sigmodontis TaxID=42156 RepID=A0A3P6UF94_LITSI|nr:unnamed protein product [Litomosoides sigmodontis]